MRTEPVTDMYGRKIQLGSWVAWGRGSQTWPHIGEVVQLEPFKVDCYTGGQGVGFESTECVLTERPDYESAIGCKVDLDVFIRRARPRHHGDWFDGPHVVTEFARKKYWTTIDGERVPFHSRLETVLRKALGC